MKVRAIWKGVVLAESDDTIVIEGNHYFPPETIKQEYFKENTRHTVCPWKGVASYYDIVVEDDVNRSGAWYYPDPSAAASQIKNYVAFWNGVKIEREESQDRQQSENVVQRVINNLFKE